MPRRAAKSPSRRRFTESERRQILREFSDSGLTLRKFADLHDFSTTSLSTWRRRYGEAKLPPAKPEFVELGALAEPGVDDGGVVCEVELASGHTLRLRGGFDGREVAAVVAALR